MSSFLARALPGKALRSESAAGGHPVTPAALLPPRRSATSFVTDDTALHFGPIYRAVQILADSASQLSLDSIRNGSALPWRDTPALVRKPSLEMDRAEFIEYLVLSMSLNGNAFCRIHRGPGGEVLDLEPLPPAYVGVNQDPRTKAVFYLYEGKTYTSETMLHISRLKVPGRLRGLGPIEADRDGISAAIQTAEYGRSYFDRTAQPAGILVSDQSLTSDQASETKRAWYAGADPTEIKVLGKGMKYTPLFVDPKDAQWIEARNYSITDTARLFGVPASLMLVTLEGNSMTYANVTQEWTSYVRFALMGYLRKIEEALSRLTPSTQDVRFNVEALLRADTATRYAQHKTALEAKFMSINEVRALENLPSWGPEYDRPAKTPPAAAQPTSEEPPA